MDATTLRIVLFVAGLVFLAGIYLYETRRRKRESAQARRRQPPKVTPLPIESEPEEEPEPEYLSQFETIPEPDEEEPEEETELLGEEDGTPPLSLRIDDDPVPNIDHLEAVEPDDRVEKPVGSGHRKEGRSKAPEAFPSKAPPPKSSPMEQQDLFGFSTEDEPPVDVPDLIIQINIRARKEPFAGPEIVKAMQETGLQFSDMAIYQRLASDGTKQPLYNLASMVEPGVFPVREMEGFSSPGLTLFTQLPGHGEGLMIFSDMLYTAERLASMLVGDLQDETHSVLTKQTIEHMRERIIEHKRQIQLARRKR